MTSIHRVTFTLTPRERDEFEALRPIQGEAWKLWQKVATKRGQDYRSIMVDNGKITALPAGHGLPWCYPMPVKCKRKSSSVEA